MEKRVEQLIEECRKKGYADKVIKSAFIKAGYNKEVVEKILGKENPSKSNGFGGMLIALCAVILIVMLAFTIPRDKNCSDIECFFEAANECKDARIQIKAEGSTLEFTSKDCMLTKEIVDFSEDEPEVIVNLFKGKTMSCSYEKNFLDREWLSLLGGIENCQGELKELIYEVRLAQLELK